MTKESRQEATRHTIDNLAKYMRLHPLGPAASAQEALFEEVAMSLAAIADHFTDTGKKDGTDTNARSMQAAIDPIERGDVVDVLHEVMQGCSEAEENLIGEIVSKVDLLPSAQPEPHWIPCCERLPERGKDVLVTRHYDGRTDNNKSCNYVETASCYGEDDDVSWSSFSDEYKMSPKSHTVIAWLPLPTPWKAESEGEDD